MEIETNKLCYKEKPKSFMKKLKTLNYDYDFADSNFLRTQFAWEKRSASDISYTVTTLAQNYRTRMFGKPERNFGKYEPNSATIGGDPTNCTKILRRNIFLKLHVYSNSSYASKKDKIFQFGNFIFLTCRNNMCHPIFWIFFTNQHYLFFQ